MGVFTADQLAVLARSSVHVATLAAFHFDTVMRYWNGSYTLTAGGYDWHGMGGLGKIEGLQESRTGESAQVRFTLSGTDSEINAKAMEQALDQAGKLVTVFLQFMREDWQPVGSPVLIWSGITQPMSSARIGAREGEPAQRSITLPAENLFYGRSRPRAGLYTDRDQQARFDGDRFFEFQPQLKNMTYVWP